MFVMIGFGVVIFCVFGGYVMGGGHMGVLWMPFEFMIILGAAAGAFFIANPKSVISHTGKEIGHLFKGPKYKKEDYLEALTMMYQVFKIAKTKGLLALEQHIEKPEDSPLFQQFPKFYSDHHAIAFLCTYLRLMSLGADNPHELVDLMDEDIETMHHEHQRVSDAIQAVADAVPALGIVAAVLGVIHTMGSISEPPEVLGKLIGGALVGTFTGILVAYGFFRPDGQRPEEHLPRRRQILSGDENRDDRPSLRLRPGDFRRIRPKCAGTRIPTNLRPGGRGDRRLAARLIERSSVMAEISIAWNEGTVGEWDSLFARATHSTLLQSFAYGRAMGRTYGYLPRLGVIRRDGAPIGLAQILERRLLKIFHDRQFHRGPLWLDGIEPDAETLEATFRLLRKACPRSLLSRSSVLPELPASSENEDLLKRCGFHRHGPGYQTVWLDLGMSEEALHAGLARDWRKRLRGAEKAGLVIDADWQADNLPWLMKQEHDQALGKGFRPMTGALAVRLRNAMVKGAAATDGALMVTALDKTTPVACILFFRHGAVATSQIGWANEAGRKSGAMRLVQWRAILALRERGVRRLDLGGVNPDSAPGVTEFKLGTGGQAVETVGQYR